MCMAFSHDNFREHDKEGNPLGPTRVIIALDHMCPEILVTNLRDHLGDFHPPLTAGTKNWLRGGIEECNAMTSPYGICSGYQPVGSDARCGGADIVPGDYRYIPDVRYGPEEGQNIGGTIVIMTRKSYYRFGKKNRNILDELHNKAGSEGGGCLMVFSSNGGRDGHPVFDAAKILDDDRMNHAKPCLLIVGDGVGLGIVPQARFLGQYNEACALKNHNAASSSQAQDFVPCSVSTLRAFKKSLPKKSLCKIPTPKPRAERQDTPVSDCSWDSNLPEPEEPVDELGGDPNFALAPYPERWWSKQHHYTEVPRRFATEFDEHVRSDSYLDDASPSAWDDESESPPSLARPLGSTGEGQEFPDDCILGLYPQKLYNSDPDRLEVGKLVGHLCDFSATCVYNDGSSSQLDNGQEFDQASSGAIAFSIYVVADTVKAAVKRRGVKRHPTRKAEARKARPDAKTQRGRASAPDAAPDASPRAAARGASPRGAAARAASRGAAPRAAPRGAPRGGAARAASRGAAPRAASRGAPRGAASRGAPRGAASRGAPRGAARGGAARGAFLA